MSRIKSNLHQSQPIDRKMERNSIFHDEHSDTDLRDSPKIYYHSFRLFDNWFGSSWAWNAYANVVGPQNQFIPLIWIDKILLLTNSFLIGKLKVSIRHKQSLGLFDCRFIAISKYCIDFFVWVHYDFSRDRIFFAFRCNEKWHQRRHTLDQ